MELRVLQPEKWCRERGFCLYWNAIQMRRFKNCPLVRTSVQISFRSLREERHAELR